MAELIELYGALTGNSIRAAIALAEAGITFAPRRLDLASGAQRHPEYLALNPTGKVPTLVDHNYSPALVINQSNAIIQYADSKAPGRLSPATSDAERFKVYDRFLFFVTDVIAPSHAAFFLKQIGKPDWGAPLDERSLEAMQVAEAFLDQDYIAGASFSLADIAAFTFATSVRGQVDWGRLPRMTRWLARINKREGVQRGNRAFESEYSDA